MNIHVIFESDPSDCESSKYIKDQPQWQQATLLKFVEELLKRGRIDHSDARQLDGDKWSLWVRRDGEDTVNHICYLARSDAPILSKFAQALLNPNTQPMPAAKQNPRRLVILQADSHAVAIGRADEFTDFQSYARLMDSVTRELFLKTINDIHMNRPMPDYTVNSDGTISIHINRPDIAYGVHIVCLAKWI